ncbi:hypothetical protein ABIC42_003699 [Variovorax sp. 1133]|nr:hypothetical protein [Variovorax paradoxus]
MSFASFSRPSRNLRESASGGPHFSYIGFFSDFDS